MVVWFMNGRSETVDFDLQMVAVSLYLNFIVH